MKDLIIRMNGEELELYDHYSIRLQADGRLLKKTALGTEVHSLGTALDPPYTIVLFPSLVEVEATLKAEIQPDVIANATYEVEYYGRVIPLVLYQSRQVESQHVFFGDEVTKVWRLFLEGKLYPPKAIEEVT